MSKKVFVTMVLCIGFMAIWGIQDANALRLPSGVSVSCHWDSVLQKYVCSLDVNADVVGLGNVLDDPDTFEATLTGIDMLVPCQNNGGGTGGDGTPFAELTTGPITQLGLITADQLYAKGKAYATLTFTDCDFSPIVQEYVAAYQEANPDDPICQNLNWSVIEALWDTDAEGNLVCNVDNLYIVKSTYVYGVVSESDNDAYFAFAYCAQDSTVETGYRCETLAKNKCTYGVDCPAIDVLCADYDGCLQRLNFD